MATKEQIETWVSLGNDYYFGENGRAVDYKEAAKWWLIAANQGHRKSQYNLGVLYYYGKKIAKDYEKALYWYKKAEAQGYGRTMYELGVVYGQGVAVKKDLSTAKKYFLKAKEKGYKNAQSGLDRVEKLVALSEQYCAGSYQNGIESEMKNYVQDSVRSQMESGGFSHAFSVELSVKFTVY